MTEIDAYQLRKRGAAIQVVSGGQPGCPLNGAALAELLASAIAWSNSIGPDEMPEVAMCFYESCAELARAPIPFSVQLVFGSA